MPNRRLYVLLALAVLGCTRDKPIEPPSKHAGSFSLTLATPNTDDAALFFELRGPGITAIHAMNTAAHLFADSAGTTIRGAIIGPPVGTLVRFDVPDTTKLADYTASVLDVAGPDNNLRASLTGYALRIER
jgi:hypothetical protein